jgi:Family of unknown function (DUF6088)
MDLNIAQEQFMSDLKSTIAALIDCAGPKCIWVPTDFAQFGNRHAIDKTLQRMVHAGELRRISRGLYDKPTISRLTKRPTSPDYRAVLEAISRRDHSRMLVDGMTAANDLGLTDAVPAHVTIYTDARRGNIQIGKLKIEFRHSAPSRIYWAGRSAMRVVQALYWLKDMLPSDRQRILRRLSKVLAHPTYGATIGHDLIDGISMMPAWMQSLVRELPGFDPQITRPAPAGRRRAGGDNA